MIYICCPLCYFLLSLSDFYIFRDKFADEPFSRIYVPDILPRYREETPKDSKYQHSPTFSEFVNYLVDLEVPDINEHFLPFYYICMPCQMDYDIIGR